MGHARELHLAALGVGHVLHEGVEAAALGAAIAIRRIRHELATQIARAVARAASVRLFVPRRVDLELDRLAPYRAG